MAWECQTFMPFGEVIGRPAHTLTEDCWCGQQRVEVPEGTILLCAEDPVRVGVHSDFDEMIAKTRLDMQKDEEN